jgi:integrase
MVTKEYSRRIVRYVYVLRKISNLLGKEFYSKKVGEILTLRVGDVQFGQHGAIMVVKGKTDARRVRVIFSAKALTEWLNHHPAKRDLEAPLWTSNPPIPPAV